MNVGCLVVAKAPIAGDVKTRIARQIGDIAAAELAAAAILDTLNAIEQFAPSRGCHLALSGSLQHSTRGDEIAQRLRSWSVSEQRGGTFAHRLVAAHIDAAARLGPGAIVQVGMDTPQLTAMDLAVLAATCSRGSRSVGLGLADDGGWWGLGTPAVHYVWGLAAVEMSTDRTGIDSCRALIQAGAEVELVHTMSDMDTWADVVAIAESAPQTEVAAVYSAISVAPETVP